MPQRTLGDQLSLPLKLAAVLAFGGFFFWLYLTAEPTTVALEEEAPEEPATDTYVYSVFENPDFFEDERLRLSRVTVEARLGLDGFWASQPRENEEVEEDEEPEEDSILVRIPRALVDQGVGVGEGEEVWVTGFLHQVNDSVLAAWEEDGVFDDPGDRGLVELEEYFIEADGLDTSPPEEDETEQPAAAAANEPGN